MERTCKDGGLAGVTWRTATRRIRMNLVMLNRGGDGRAKSRPTMMARMLSAHIIPATSPSIVHIPKHPCADMLGAAAASGGCVEAMVAPVTLASVKPAAVTCSCAKLAVVPVSAACIACIATRPNSRAVTAKTAISDRRKAGTTITLTSTGWGKAAKAQAVGDDENG